MIAMPASEFADDPPVTVSAVSLKLALKRVETVLAVGVATSSASEESDALPEAIGASLTAVTLWESVTVPALNAVVPPLVATFTVAPVVTAVALESINSTEIVGAGPLKFVAGTKCRLSVLFNVIALDALLIVDSAVHVLPSDVYSQVPLALSAV